MRSAVFSLMALFISFVAPVAADDTVTDSSTGVSFPSTINIQHNGKDYKLNATGVSTRKKFFVKVYSVASYLQEGANAPDGDKSQALLSDQYAKQLTIKWVHEATSAQVQNGYEESFKNIFTDDQQKREVDSFLKFFNADVKKGDEHVLRWLPKGYVEVLINGKSVGTVVSEPFAKGLWSIWFGSNSVVDKTKLVSLLK